MSDFSTKRTIVTRTDVTAKMSAHTAVSRYSNELLEELHQAALRKVLGVGLAKWKSMFETEHNVWVLVHAEPCVRTETCPHTAACSVRRVLVFR